MSHEMAKEKKGGGKKKKKQLKKKTRGKCMPWGSTHLLALSQKWLYVSSP